MWMVTENPEGITVGYMSRFKARKCLRCGCEKVSLTWSRYIDGPHYDRHDVIRYGCECYRCEESNMTKRRFRTPEEAVAAWNQMNISADYIGDGPIEKQAALPSDVDQLKHRW